MTIRVLVVDDSALIRQILSKGLAVDPEIDVVGTAADPYAARDQILRLRPNVMTLDVEMPRMDGVEFLRRLMPQFPLPTVMVSSLTKRSAATTLAALEAGAIDFVEKPTVDVAQGMKTLIRELVGKIKVASRAQVRHHRKDTSDVRRVVSAPVQALRSSTDKVLAIGASTGGTEAGLEVIRRLPPSCPGVVVVQHMPPVFTNLYAERLNRECKVTAKEAVNNDRVIPGRVLIAPGGKQMRLVRTGGHFIVKLGESTKVSGHAPSVDVLFESVAEQAQEHGVGVILTGMGQDGATGLLSMRRAGAYTIGQDEATSVVYGMPKVANDLGAVQRQAGLEEIAGIALERFRYMEEKEEVCSARI
ncbi:MAG: chemotaxis response regulator protein-glutamate methylesterase [Myxococcota bacterium]